MLIDMEKELRYFNTIDVSKGSIMARKKSDEPTRQIFANIREDIYILVKSKSAEDRLSMREILEKSLLMYLGSDMGVIESDSASTSSSTVWDDEYLGMQAGQPVGTPIELSEDEAKRIALEAFL